MKGGNQVYFEFGIRLKVARERAGLTQEELGERVGLTRTSICNLEAGKQKLLVHTLVGLAEILHVQVYDLLGKR